MLAGGQNSTQPFTPEPLDISELAYSEPSLVPAPAGMDEAALNVAAVAAAGAGAAIAAAAPNATMDAAPIAVAKAAQASAAPPAAITAVVDAAIKKVKAAAAAAAAASVTPAAPAAGWGAQMTSGQVYALRHSALTLSERIPHDPAHCDETCYC